MNLRHEYLEKNIKEKLFKNFEYWNKEDFHFLLSLLNYPSYYSLGLIILTNLKNWITYSSGDFFYTIETIENILKKYNFNYDPYKESLNEKIDENKNNSKNEKIKENIKLNINKKENDDDNLIKINNDCEFVFGDMFSIDIFSFGFWVFIFILFLILKTLQGKSFEQENTYKNKFNIPFDIPFNKPKQENNNKSENDNKNKNDFNLPFNKKELLNKVIDYFVGNKNMFFE